jgi:hypothetical protein
MSRLVASDNALRALLLLWQHQGGMRTSEVAKALGSSYTGAEKALDILVAEGLVSVTERRAAFAATPRALAAVRFALALLPPDAALAALAHGNEAVEFAAADDAGMLVVFRRFSEPEAEARFREAAAVLRGLTPGLMIEFESKEDLRDQLLGDLTPRLRAQGMRVLAGAIDRTFPDRTRRGDFGARPLGRLHENVAAPSVRRLRALAHQYGLRRIIVFGSATRTDFRPDSDVDLLVEPSPGHRLGLSERVGLMADAARLFGRDVDVLTAPVRRAALAQRISRDSVVVYDAT